MDPLYILQRILLFNRVKACIKGPSSIVWGVHLPYWVPWVFVCNNHHIEIKLYLVELTSTTRAKIMLETP